MITYRAVKGAGQFAYRNTRTFPHARAPTAHILGDKIGANGRATVWEIVSQTIFSAVSEELGSERWFATLKYLSSSSPQAIKHIRYKAIKPEYIMSLPASFDLTPKDAELLLSANVHLGSKNVQVCPQ